MSHSLLLLVLVLSLFSGCARHIVVEPEAVASQSSADWTIRAAPAPSQSRP
jgi:hypothetical protein